MVDRVVIPRVATLSLLTLLSGAPGLTRRVPGKALPNDNRVPAGVLRDGVLTLNLDATRSMWHPDGDSLPGLDVAVFAEDGNAPSVPGPLIRVPRGTEIRAFVRNSLERDTIAFHMPSFVPGAVADSTFIPPGEVREIRVRAEHAGTFMVGALIVRDSAADAPSDERLFFIKSARAGPASRPSLEINGRLSPDTTVLRLGQRYRLRFIHMAVANPSAALSLTAQPDSIPAMMQDMLLLQWRLVAKDGADLPAGRGLTRAARQLIAMGETYDFEFAPSVRGNLRIEIRAGGRAGRLLTRAPIRVE